MAASGAAGGEPITGPMRSWCVRLISPERLELVRIKEGGTVFCLGASMSPPTRDMVARLERAGLICWVSTGDVVRQRAQLTAAGVAAAVSSVPGKVAAPRSLRSMGHAET